jgi:hypothetical protein
MIPVEELKVGLFVWWITLEWSGPCVVTYVDDTFFRVKSLDSFEESINLHIYNFSIWNRSPLSEMTVRTIDEVREYFKEQLRVKEYAIEEMAEKGEGDINIPREKFLHYKKKVEAFLEEHS